MNTRMIFTAAAMPADQARAIVELICASSPERAAEQRRNRIERRYSQAIQRVLKFAKHETIRKAQRYLHSHRPLSGQDEQADHPDSVKIAFNVDELSQDLNTMLETEGLSALTTASQDTLEHVGFRDPWKLPAQDVLDFIARRQNLLSNVPLEIFDTIRNEISAGLNKGESIRALSKRISAAFDEIGKGRAQVIAQTETAAAYGFASDKAARAAGITYKKWIHSVISKVPRADHLAINGLIIPMDEAYPVGNPPLMYPHAPDGAAEDVINCRCMSIPVSEADYQAQKK